MQLGVVKTVEIVERSKNWSPLLRTGCFGQMTDAMGSAPP